jgi:hypothetical protein
VLYKNPIHFISKFVVVHITAIECVYKGEKEEKEVFDRIFLQHTSSKPPFTQHSTAQQAN